MNSLTQMIHSKVYYSRKGILLILISLCISAAFAKKISWNYGVETKMNFANQICFNPLNIENGNYNFDKLTCFGINSFLERSISRKCYVLSRFGYNQKGFTQPNQTVFLSKNGAINEAPITASTSHKNIFHYVNLDLVIKYNLGKKFIVPYVNAGLRINYLVSKNIGSANYFQIKGNQFYNYNFYKKAALGLIAGAGITLNEKIYFAFETDIDITNSVKTANLAVKNWVNSVCVGFNINELFKIY